MKKRKGRLLGRVLARELSEAELGMASAASSIGVSACGPDYIKSYDERGNWID